MYYGLCYSIAEMSPALPHTGGAYSFARSAMGPWGGFITGLAENMEYVITPAVVVGAMGFLMHDIVAGLFDMAGEPWWNSPVTWWAIFYVMFVWIDIVGDRGHDAVHGRDHGRSRWASWRSSSSRLCWPQEKFEDVEPVDEHRAGSGGGARDLPEGEVVVPPRGDPVNSIPFAIWFFLAIGGGAVSGGGDRSERRDGRPKGSVVGDAHVADRRHP